MSQALENREQSRLSARERILAQCIGTSVGVTLDAFRLMSRIRGLRLNEADNRLPSGTPFIAVFWHEELLLLALSQGRMLDLSRERPAALVSTSFDGEMLARLLARSGMPTVRGSSSRGGVLAYRQLLGILRSGGSVIIAPDGPKGPRRRIGLGVLRLARASGAPLLPIAIRTSRGMLLSSWDRQVVPLPFAQIGFALGDLIWIGSDRSTGAFESSRSEIEDALRIQGDRARSLIDHD